MVAVSWLQLVPDNSVSPQKGAWHTGVNSLY